MAPGLAAAMGLGSVGAGLSQSAQRFTEAMQRKAENERLAPMRDAAGRLTALMMSPNTANPKDVADLIRQLSTSDNPQFQALAATASNTFASAQAAAQQRQDMLDAQAADREARMLERNDRMVAAEQAKLAAQQEADFRRQEAMATDVYRKSQLGIQQQQMDRESANQREYRVFQLALRQIGDMTLIDPDAANRLSLALAKNGADGYANALREMQRAPQSQTNTSSAFTDREVNALRTFLDRAGLTDATPQQKIAAANEQIRQESNQEAISVLQRYVRNLEATIPAYDAAVNRIRNPQQSQQIASSAPDTISTSGRAAQPPIDSVQQIAARALQDIQGLTSGRSDTIGSTPDATQTPLPATRGSEQDLSEHPFYPYKGPIVSPSTITPLRIGGTTRINSERTTTTRRPSQVDTQLANRINEIENMNLEQLGMALGSEQDQRLIQMILDRIDLLRRQSLRR